jgi:hypothetical protein
MDNNFINVTKEDIMSLLKQAYGSAVFGYLDLCEITCQEILNEFLCKKIQELDLKNVNLNLGCATKTNSNSLTYDWSSNFFSVLTTQ